MALNQFKDVVREFGGNFNVRVLDGIAVHGAKTRSHGHDLKLEAKNCAHRPASRSANQFDETLEFRSSVVEALAHRLDVVGIDVLFDLLQSR